MSIDFTSGTGHLFNRLGKVFGTIGSVTTNQSYTLVVETDGVSAQYTTNQSYAPTLQTSLTNAQNACNQYKSDLQVIAGTTVIQTVHADTPLPSLSLDYALPKLIADMIAAGATVDANTVSVSVSAGSSNVGNGTCIASVTGADGKTLENVIPETIAVTCTSDSQPGTGGTVVGSEVFTARGQSATANKLDFNWPTGSGGQTTVRSANAAEDATTSNLLTNGDFEAFTSHAPDSWTIVTGTAGTTLDYTATAYRGSYALRFIGTAAAERTRISQTLRSVAASTAGNVTPSTRYAIAARIRVSASTTGGVLRIALRDGTTDGATIIGGQSITVTLSGATTSYVLYTAQLNTPAALPDALYLVAELTAAIDNGKSVYVDDVILTPMVQHQKGPYVAVIPGSTKFVIGDTFAVAVSNARDGLIQEWFNRVFNMDQRGLLLPSDTYGAETIPDSLIS